MSALNRKDARASLFAVLDALAQFQEGFDHIPEELNGKSPLFTITGEEVDYQALGSEQKNTFVFLVTIYVKRTGDLGDVENLVDDLIQDVGEAVLTWNNGEFESRFISAISEKVNGSSYRTEDVLVSVDWTGQ